MIDTDLITYLAKLSKLALSDSDKERFAAEMSAIVNLIDTMNEVNMEDQMNLNHEGVHLESLREDKIVPSYDTEAILRNAYHKKDGFFEVPKMME